MRPGAPPASRSMSNSGRTSHARRPDVSTFCMRFQWLGWMSGLSLTRSGICFSAAALLLSVCCRRLGRRPAGRLRAPRRRRSRDRPGHPLCRFGQLHRPARRRLRGASLHPHAKGRRGPVTRPCGAGAQGPDVVVFDCYRPARAVADLVDWSKTKGPPDPRWFPHVRREKLVEKGYVGLQSNHSRGSTVDVTLAPAGKPDAVTAGCDARKMARSTWAQASTVSIQSAPPPAKPSRPGRRRTARCSLTR